MTLTKAQRAAVREMFGGNCAYCGDPLGERWHADHVKAVHRKIKYTFNEKQGTYVGKTVGVYKPEHDVLDNHFPACAPCNIHKGCSELEHWRLQLQEQVQVARRNSGPFRHAERFKLITVSDAPIVFHFEKFLDTPTEPKSAPVAGSY